MPERTDPRAIRHGGARVFLAYEQQCSLPTETQRSPPTETRRAVGLALCFVGFSSFKARPLINIHDIAVRPEVRGQGHRPPTAGRSPRLRPQPWLLQGHARSPRRQPPRPAGLSPGRLSVNATRNLVLVVACFSMSGSLQNQPQRQSARCIGPAIAGQRFSTGGKRLRCACQRRQRQTKTTLVTAI